MELCQHSLLEIVCRLIGKQPVSLHVCQMKDPGDRRDLLALAEQLFGIGLTTFVGPVLARSLCVYPLSDVESGDEHLNTIFFPTAHTALLIGSANA